MKPIRIKKQTRIISTLVVLILTNILIGVPLKAQENVQLIIGSGTDLSLEGTSNVHDWSCEVKEITGKGAFVDAILKGEKIPDNPIKDVHLTIPVKSIKSGKSKMDDIMYDALKAEEHPTIHYNLVSASVVREEGNEFTLHTKGKLTVAGVTRQIEHQVQGKKIDGHSVKFTGIKTLQMSSFNVEPPKALFGAIRSGNAVDVQFNAVFKKVEHTTQVPIDQ